MAVELKSVSTNQTLRLALKALVVALIVFWMRSGGFGILPVFLFLVIVVFFYTRPPLHYGRFLPSMFVLVSLPFFIPRMVGIEEVFISAIWGLLFMILIGVKNIVLLKHKEVYYVLHLILIAVSTAFLFSRFSFFLQIVLFIVFLFLFREFYATNKSIDSENINLIASTEALIAIEFAWVISFLSINFLSGAALLTLFIFIFHDTVMHYLRKSLSREMILRNAAVFALLTVIIISLPV